MSALEPVDDGPFWEHLPEGGLEAIFDHASACGWVLALACTYRARFKVPCESAAAGEDFRRMAEHYGRRCQLAVLDGGLWLVVEPRR